jgi:uncharacterized membrane protein YesL
VNQGRRNGRQEIADLLEYAEQWAMFILPNLLWCILSLPIVTLPAATAGLFAVMSQKARGQQPEVFQVFFHAMRRLWLPATVIFLVDMAAGGLIVVNLTIFPMMNITSNPLAFLSWSVTLFVALLLALVNLYLWSLLVLVDGTLRQITTTACQIAFTFPLWSAGILVLAIVPILVSLLLPQAFFVLVTFSLVAYIINRGTWQIIRRFLSPEILKTLETGQSPLT